MATTEGDAALAEENRALRRRVEELEAELGQFRADTAQTLAEAQESLYWFERWGIDFNSHMGRPGVEVLRRSVRALRSVYRSLLKAKRRVLP